MGFVLSSEVFPSRHPTSPLDDVFPSCSWPDRASHDRDPSTRSQGASRLQRRRVVSDLQTETCAFTTSCPRLSAPKRVQSSGECHPSITSRPSPRLSSTTRALALGPSCDASSLAHASGVRSPPPATLSRLELLLTSSCRALVNPRSTRRHCYTDLPAPATHQGSSSSRPCACTLNSPSLHSATQPSPPSLPCT
jgi:hypothetical protein